MEGSRKKSRGGGARSREKTSMARSSKTGHSGIRGKGIYSERTYNKMEGRNTKHRRKNSKIKTQSVTYKIELCRTRISQTIRRKETCGRKKTGDLYRLRPMGFRAGR